MTKNRFLSLTITILISTFFFGCSWFDSSTQEIESSKKHELDGAPIWVTSFTQENTTSHTGASVKTEKNNFNSQKNEASKNAKASLKEEITIKIEKLLNSFDTDKKISTQEMSKVLNKIVISSMKYVKVTKLWKSNSQTIYVLAVVNIKDIKNEMEKIINQSFKSTQNIYQNFTLAKSNGSIDISLKN